MAFKRKRKNRKTSHPANEYPQIAQSSKNLRRKRINKPILYKKKSILIHRPITRSLTKNMENFSFCSIPLRKTVKNIEFKNQQRENKKIHENNNLGCALKADNSVVVLFNQSCGAIHKKFEQQSAESVQINSADGGSGDPRTDLDEEDYKVIEQVLETMDELGMPDPVCSKEIEEIKLDLMRDMSLDSLIDLYKIDNIHDNFKTK